MKPQQLARDDTALLVVDVQERLAAAMEPEAVTRMLGRLGALIEGARALGLPIVVTEQYPKGLGHTVAAIRERLGDLPVIEKLKFSALDDKVRARLSGRRHVVVAGMETHVCVYQSARDLVLEGRHPTVCMDAVLSRTAVDRQAGLELARAAGATLSSVEAVLFDLLGTASTPEFKRISAAVK
ncbi:MAG TPA: isochorismatase family protein [Myxococcaceae bacterium]|nr:isochorismatase family protein [Myxococcaceae bacterium]